MNLVSFIFPFALVVILLVGCDDASRSPSRLTPGVTTSPAATQVAMTSFKPPVVPPHIRAALDKKLREVRNDDTPLAVALATLQVEAGLPMEVRWEVIARAKVDPTTPMQFRVFNVRASKCLDLYVDSVSNPEVKLRWWVADDSGPARVVVSTEAEYVQANIATYVYDVSDLLEPGKADVQLADLVQALKEVVDPGSWVDGEPDGFATIVAANGRLTIRQVKANHAQLGRVLSNIRVITPKRRAVDAALASGKIKRHLLSFPDATFKKGDAPTYFLDGVTLGKGDEGFAKLLVAIERFSPGSILVDTSKYSQGIPMYYTPDWTAGSVRPYEARSKELFAKLNAHRLRFEVSGYLYPSLIEDQLPPLGTDRR